MNICFLSQEYPPETHVGGIGTYTYNMASALANLGHTVHVITSTKKKHKYLEHNSGVSIHYVRKCIIKPLELSHLVYSYLVNKKISTIKCHFDIVHASEYANEAFWFSMRKPCKLITRLATPFSIAEELNGKKIFGPRPLINLMEKRQTLHSDGIFTSTTALAKKVAKKWGIDPSLITVIPNSIDLKRVKKIGENGFVPAILKDKEFLVYFGRLEKRKGVCVLADSLNAIFKKFPSIYMVFIGSDADYNGRSMVQYIKEKSGEYSDRLIFFKNQPHEKLFPIVKSAKIVVLPSLWEAFGFVCIEAMALGRVVIATSGSGFDEIIEDGVSGYLVKPGNSEHLSAQIMKTLCDSEAVYKVSEAAKKRVEYFEVTKVAHQLIKYYKSFNSVKFKDSNNG